MSLETGLESLKRGEFVLLFDSAGRENEIDMVVAAEFITPEHVARMRQNAGGLLCIALENNFAKDSICESIFSADNSLGSFSQYNFIILLTS